jgi:MoaA/NifB/PqqE/SkfB family radical SAM enzyme
MGISRTVTALDRARGGAQYLANRLTGRPTSIALEVTKRCNATCDFCPYWEANVVREVTDFTPIIRHFRPLHVSITGGEPLLRKDLADIVRQVKSVKGFRYVAIYTNGWLLTERKLEELTEAGVNQIQISLNYPDERMDEERGIAGLFRKLAAFLPEMVRKGFDQLAVGTFLCEENLDCVVDAARLAHGWGVKHAFNSYSRLKNDNHQHVLSPEHIDRASDVVECLIELKRKNRNILSSAEYLRAIPSFFVDGQRSGCRAGDKFLYVDQEGHLKACPELPPFGHISDLDSARPESVSCGLCWYACRGEHQTSLTAARLKELVVG